MQTLYNLVIGIDGKLLNDFEKDLFTLKNPYGIILFSRNIESKEQVKALTKSIKSINPDINIFIDQEGGRVARIREPIFSRKLYPAKFLSDIFYQNPTKGLDIIYKNAYLIGAELKNEFGINGIFAPVCDLYYEYTHDVIGDRSLGSNPDEVALMAKAWYDGLLDAGTIPCIKHIPGHGRAVLDSHIDLPIINTELNELEKTDFKVFKLLKDCGLAMTAHIIFEALDKEHPVTTSKKAIDYIRNQLGYQNLLISDDLSMKALKGSIAQNAEASINAGCDLLLHCNGKKDEILETYMFASPIRQSTMLKLEAINDKVKQLASEINYKDIYEEYLELINPYV